MVFHVKAKKWDGLKLLHNTAVDNELYCYSHEFPNYLFYISTMRKQKIYCPFSINR